MDNAVSALPPPLAERAKDSVGAAVQIAASIPGPAGGLLRDTAQAVFTVSFGLALLACTALAFVGAVLVLRYLPAHHLGREQEQAFAHPSANLPT